MRLTDDQLEKLRITKGKKNLSILALAKEIGMSRYTTSSIINGRTDGLSEQTVNKIKNYVSASN